MPPHSGPSVLPVSACFLWGCDSFAAFEKSLLGKGVVERDVGPGAGAFSHIEPAWRGERFDLGLALPYSLGVHR